MATLTTFAPKIKIKSAEVNANFEILNTGSTNVSTDFSVTSSFHNSMAIVDSSAATVTGTLPDATTHKGLSVTIKSKDTTNGIYLDSLGGKIDNTAATYFLEYKYRSVTAESDGVDWWLKG